MSPMMNRVVVILVLVELVLCGKQNTTASDKKPTEPPFAAKNNSSSSVTIAHKVQNVSVDYKNNHSTPSNASYATKPPIISNVTTSKPLIISTSKETRLIQNPTKLNDSIALASLRAGPTIPPQHLNTIASKVRNNELKKDALKTPPPKTKPTPSSHVQQKNSAKNKTVPLDLNYSYFKMFKPKNITTQIVVERQEVREMKFVEDSKGKKLMFYLVSDKIVPSLDRKNLNQTAKLRAGNTTTNVKEMPFINEHNGHSKPYKGNLSQTVDSTDVPSIVKALTILSPAPTIYTVRPSRHNISVTTSSPLIYYYHKKTNVTRNLVKSKNTQSTNNSNFDCLRCVGSKKQKLSKYPEYPTKKESSPTDSRRAAVKLQGPDGDSILLDTKQYYSIIRPEVQIGRAYNMTRRPRVPKSGVNSRILGQNGQVRFPFSGQDSMSYAPNVGRLPESPFRNTEIGFELLNRNRINNKQPDMSDLYSLDDLESGQSSISAGHVKYETKEIHIPYPVTIEKRVSYPIHIKVDRPVPVHIEKPYPVHVEKKVPVPVKIHVPQPYPVEQEVPYPVKIPIDVPRPVEVPKPVPYMVENPVPIQVIKHVKIPVKIPVDVPVPFKVPVHVEKRVPYFVEKRVPFEVPVPVEKPYFVEVTKPFEVPVEKPEAVTVEKKIPVPVQVIEFIKVPIPVKIPQEHHYQQRSGEQRTPPGNGTMHLGEILAAKLEAGNISTSQPEQIKTTKITRRIGTLSDFNIGTENGLFTLRGDSRPIPFRLPNMISVEFHHPEFTSSQDSPTISTNPEKSSSQEK